MIRDARRVDSPLVTVLLPCYNAEAWLDRSMESILRQTYSNLEVLAIDDGSSDTTMRRLAAFAGRDSRVRLEPNARNRGVIFSLNKGLALARGHLIARMDADDIAHPERIEKQVRYFSQHPDTELLSTDYTSIGARGQLLSNPTPYRFSGSTVRFLMFFANPLCHPTVMGRTDVFQKYPYSTSAMHVEDFELWQRMASSGVVIRNLPERLVGFRSAGTGVSSRHADEQTSMFLRITGDAVHEYFGLRLDADVQRVLTNRMRHGMVSDGALKTALRLFADMRQEYIRRESLGREDRLILGAFADRHLANIFLHSYKRSSRQQPARRRATRAAIAMAFRNPAPICRLALSKTREWISR